MRPALRIALLGFGNVGRRFAELFPGPYARTLRALGVDPRLIGIATARHGTVLDPAGLDPRLCVDVVRRGASLAGLHRGPAVRSNAAFIARAARAGAHVLVEVTPLDPRRGEPATSHVRAALRRGLHVVTANKGPAAFAARRLRALASRRGRLFLHEGAVLDGTPVFNLVERCLPGARVLGFRGALNATTNHVLSRLEAGGSFAEALAEAQAQGIAEADPGHDLDGWDSALKGCVLANALMGAAVTPKTVDRRGIRRLSPASLRAARRAGRRIRLVVRATRRAGRVRVRVRPERLALGDPLAGAGADSMLVLETDVLGEIGILERGMCLDQTAYALLSDLTRVAQVLAARRRKP